MQSPDKAGMLSALKTKGHEYLTEVFHFLWMRNEGRDYVYSMGRSSTVNVNCNVLYNVKK